MKQSLLGSFVRSCELNKFLMIVKLHAVYLTELTVSKHLLYVLMMAVFKSPQAHSYTIQVAVLANSFDISAFRSKLIPV